MPAGTLTAGVLKVELPAVDATTGRLVGAVSSPLAGETSPVAAPLGLLLDSPVSKRGHWLVRVAVPALCGACGRRCVGITLAVTPIASLQGSFPLRNDPPLALSKLHCSLSFPHAPWAPPPRTRTFTTQNSLPQTVSLSSPLRLTHVTMQRAKSRSLSLSLPHPLFTLLSVTSHMLGPPPPVLFLCLIPGSLVVAISSPPCTFLKHNPRQAVRNHFLLHRVPVQKDALLSITKE